MSEDEKDKQYDPSEQKLRKAREQGDIPRSTEINVAIMYLGAWLAFSIGAGYGVRHWLTMAERAMGSEPWPDSVFALAGSLWRFAGLTLIALCLVPLIAIILGLVMQRALIFSPKKLAFDFKRINPAKNAGQKFGKSGLVTFAISVAKAVFVCLGGWYLFSLLWDRLAGSALGSGTVWVSGLGELLRQVLLMAMIISIGFSVVDFLWKRHEHHRKNRMSRKEMEDEHKESEGDPHMKAARRQKAVDLATRQMLADVARADVVVVNPTHYAVALEWKRGSGRAPVCLAKGVDEVAARIRERARDNKVPVWSDPPCARAIFATVDIGQEIRREHFAAVAAAIRFAEQMREKARAGW